MSECQGDVTVQMVELPTIWIEQDTEYLEVQRNQDLQAKVTLISTSIFNGDSL